MKYRPLVFVALVAAILGVMTNVSCDRLKNIKASISGTVYMDGRPQSGHVELKDANGNIVAMDDTTLAGHYILKDIKAGDYTLQFLNMQGVPFGGEVTVKVRMGRFEQVDLHIKSTDRISVNK